MNNTGTCTATEVTKAVTFADAELELIRVSVETQIHVLKRDQARASYSTRQVIATQIAELEAIVSQINAD